jgi:hypothetical protein
LALLPAGMTITTIAVIALKRPKKMIESGA